MIEERGFGHYYALAMSLIICFMVIPGALIGTAYHFKFWPGVAVGILYALWLSFAGPSLLKNLTETETKA
jgi:hypothetical protein